MLTIPNLVSLITIYLTYLYPIYINALSGHGASCPPVQQTVWPPLNDW